MGKTGYSLKNRIFAAVIIAILAQSIVFGILLFSTEVFSNISREPYRMMESRLRETNMDVSTKLNNILLEGKGLEKELSKKNSPEEIQEMLLDTLNRMNYISGIFYVDLVHNRGVYYKDAEPNVYSVNYGDISCVFGRVLTKKHISMANDWQGDFPAGADEKIQNYLGKDDYRERWVHSENDSLYYIISEEDNGSHILGMQISGKVLQEMLRVDKEAYEGMQFMLLDGQGDTLFYFTEAGQVWVAEKRENGIEKIGTKLQDGEYIGWMEQLQLYGHIEGEKPLYLGIVSKKSSVDSLMWDVVYRVAAAHLLSLLLGIALSFIAVQAVLKPLNKLHFDIRGQKMDEVHFEGSRITEIDNICQALNDMTKRLEESYSRFSFTMEEVEENIGSFEYRSDTGTTQVSHSMKRILDIPDEYLTKENVLLENGWDYIRNRLSPVSELDAFCYTDGAGKNHCVAFKAKEEENGVFGMVIDKSEEYEKICHFRYASEHDYLTKLYNASYLLKRGQELLEKNKDKVNALVFCDMDNLKYVNDNYGHSMGDNYIVSMAEKLKDMAMGEGRIAARISGDEFAVLMSGFDSKKEIEDIVMDMHRRKKVISLSDGEEYLVRASVGIAYAVSADDTIDQLIKRADSAMYEVKHARKNEVGIYRE